MSSSKSRPILLVDGYNVIGAWPSLCQKRDNVGMEEARRELTESLVNYSAFEGLDIRIIFDAHYQDTPSLNEKVTDGVLLHYTGFGQTADTYIEKTCATLARKIKILKGRLIVATSDRAQRLTVVGYGAEWLSAEQLATVVEHSTRSCQRRHKSNKRPANRSLANSLDPEAQKRLAMLRMGLQ
ncbi:MAG: NYN domain-containing protein [Oscillatoriales cyanobacterium RM1_1_9]|nr:NYN domain-containing protein [Oscillatoriales cyanobacterium SM2_3_0]NJO45734.1 NYN domain-containing protein [Oscillatoriales cyanobacterium RM2_1_1]NJO71032.1 NYN domain-containing protein [Oscillatoriales cyanobacterium RM1_1_9]